MNSLSDLRSSNIALQPSAATETLQKAAKTSTEDSKIEKSAKDFEAILLGNWLQQAEETFAKVPGSDEDEQDSATSQFSQMAMQSLGTSFASSGGIGIAKMIATQLQKTQGTPQTSTTNSAQKPR